MDEKFPLALPQGKVLAGQYIIEKVLGQGGFGITYMALDYKNGHSKVAIKEFFPDTLATRTGTTVSSFPGERGEHFAYGKETFMDEATTLAKFVGNENIVRIHTYFEENNTAYFVMDFIEGHSLEDHIKQNGGKLKYDTAEELLLPIIDALSIVHSAGIIHRDVTPDNIYITNDGSVKLLDFGAARYSLGDKSKSLDVILKHGYAPKEQYTRRGKQGPFTDVYSLAATFYYALTGKRPPDSIERMDEDDLIPPSSLGVKIPDKKEEALLKALEVQPADRFQSMKEFREALAGTLESPGSAKAPGPEEETDIPAGKDKKKRNKIIYGIVIALIVLALAIPSFIYGIKEGTNRRADIRLCENIRLALLDAMSKPDVKSRNEKFFVGVSLADKSTLILREQSAMAEHYSKEMGTDRPADNLKSKKCRGKNICFVFFDNDITVFVDGAPGVGAGTNKEIIRAGDADYARNWVDKNKK